MKIITSNYFLSRRLARFNFLNLVQTSLWCLLILNLTSCGKDVKQKLDTNFLVKYIEMYSANGELTSRIRSFYNSNNYETMRLTYSIDPTTNLESPFSKLEYRISNDTVYRFYYLFKTNVSDYVLSTAYAFLQDADGFTQKQLRLTTTSPNLMPVVSTITFDRTVIDKDKVEYLASSNRKFVVDKYQKTATMVNYSASSEVNRTTYHYDCFDGPSFEKLAVSYNFQKEFGKGLILIRKEVFEDFEDPSKNNVQNTVISKDSEGRVSEVLFPTGARNKYYY